MPHKYETTLHDGVGRKTKLWTNDDQPASAATGRAVPHHTPGLVEPSLIPPLHQGKSLPSVDLTEPQPSDKIRLGHLPSLHHFSKMRSGQEVIETLRNDYLDPLTTHFDLIFFPPDRAGPYRTLSQYHSFIAKVSEGLPELTFGWALPSEAGDLDNAPSPSLGVVGLPDLARFVGNSRKTWNHLSSVVQQFPTLLRYAPAIPPLAIPLMTYLGVDLFDPLYGDYMAGANVFMGWAGMTHLDVSKAFTPPCACPACLGRGEALSTQSWLTNHNRWFTDQVIQQVGLAMDEGRLRDLVKRTVLVDPYQVAVLRLADTLGSTLLEQFTPILKKQTLPITAHSDHRRPEVLRYHQRLLTRYQVPPWTQLVLLLPCSARKPYSNSRSHKMFASAVKAGLGKFRHGLLELIVTSPLGVVPRHLELAYPAAFYDIAVTGDWTREEEQMVEQNLKSVLSQLGGKVKVVSFLSGAEGRIIQEIAGRHPELGLDVLPLDASETDNNSLRILRERLRELREEGTMEVVSRASGKLEYFKAMADHQYGAGVGDLLFPPSTLVKRRSMLDVTFDGKDQVATLHEGHITLSVYGAKQLAEKHRCYDVTFDGESFSGSAIYTPGIVAADEEIRPGDDVLVFSRSDKLLGIGRSYLSGTELVSSTFGLGVSVRKKVKS